MFGYSTLTLEQFASLSLNDYSLMELDAIIAGSGLSGVIVLYREVSNESYQFATYYADLHNIPSDQLIGLPCSADEILTDYDTFYEEIEGPLIQAASDEYGVINTNVILVGFGVPGGFYDGGDIIATASRLSRINFVYDPVYNQSLNPLYNRRNFRAYDEADNALAIVTSRIDAPSLEIAKQVVDNSRIAIRQGAVNGTFFFSKYSPIYSEEDENYALELDDFESSTLQVLNVNIYTTTYWDEYTNSVIPFLEDDSIMWSWRADRAGCTFFKDPTARRYFLYNADDDGAASMRDAEDKRWPMLALSSGYPVTAGAMSNPTADGYLRPRPFFEAILNGATVGEAFLFACPYLDWTISLIGDPLIAFRFPNAQPLDTTLTPVRGWDRMKNSLSDAIGFQIAKEKSAIESHQLLLSSVDISVKTELFPAFALLAQSVVESTSPLFQPALDAIVAFPQNGGSFNTFLTNNNYKVSQLWPVILQNGALASTENLFERGSWFFETEIVHDLSQFVNYHFELEIASDENFTDSLGAFYSESSIVGWTYEKELGVFDDISSRGVASNYVGRRIKYTAFADEYLTRGLMFFARLRQIANSGEVTEYVSKQMAVSS